jgi:hypothetical protein
VSIGRRVVRRVSRERIGTMRFMMILKADSHTETGALPTEEGLAAMAKFNEELVKAGYCSTPRDSSRAPKAPA